MANSIGSRSPSPLKPSPQCGIEGDVFAGEDGRGGGPVDGGKGGSALLELAVVPAGGPPAAEGKEVHTCGFCSKSFDRVKALHGHMRVHEREPGKAPSPPQPRREKGKEEEEELIPLPPMRGWTLTGQRGRMRRSATCAGLDGEGSAWPPAKRVHLEVNERPCIPEMVLASHNLMYLKTHQPCLKEGARESHVGSEPATITVAFSYSEQAAVTVAVPAAESPQENFEEISTSFVCNAMLDLDLNTVPAGDDDADPPPAKDNGVAEINSPVTIATVTAPGVVVTALDAAKSKETGGHGGSGKASGAAIVSEGAAMAVVEQKGTFNCPICGKSFTSYQGLGGHMTSHRKGKEVAENSQAPSRAPAKGNGKHICKKCDEEYPTGQALGGHMRKHYTATFGGKDTGKSAAAAASALPLALQMEEEGRPAVVTAASALPLAPQNQEEGTSGEALVDGNNMRSNVRLFGVNIGVTETPKEQ